MISNNKSMFYIERLEGSGYKKFTNMITLSVDDALSDLRHLRKEQSHRKFRLIECRIFPDGDYEIAAVAQRNNGQ